MNQLPQVAAGTLSKRQAARNAGFADSTSISRIETPTLKAQFSKLLRQHIPAHKIAQRIAEGLDAQETKFFQFEGRVSDSRDVINYAERRQYAKLAAEFGQYVEPENKADVNVAVGFTLVNGITNPKRDGTTVPCIER